MREIKFRAWLPAIKKMTYEHTLDELMNWNTKIEDNGTAIWLQYTGLKDKNGKEIYEGDQLYHPGNLSDELQYVGDVTWNQEDARWEVHNFHGNFPYVPNGCTVQGNIHEHPELLEREGRT